MNIYFRMFGHEIRIRPVTPEYREVQEIQNMVTVYSLVQKLVETIHKNDLMEIGE